MDLCDDGHEEVCYESRECPVCKVQAELDVDIKAFEQELETANERIRELEADKE